MANVQAGKIGELKAGIKGEILLPSDGAYEDARKIWNAMIDKRPAMIVRCAGPADVLASVNFARNQGLELAVRGGGHNIAGSALCNDGLVIDLSTMRSVQIALRKRAVEPERIEQMVSKIVRELESGGENEVSSEAIGEIVMAHLREIDDVAYVRFASVYRNFGEVKDFRAALDELSGDEDVPPAVPARK